METERSFYKFKTLLDLMALANSSLDTQEVMQMAVEAAISLVAAETGSLLLSDQDTGQIFFEVALAPQGEMLKKEVRLARGQGIAGWVIDTGEPLVVNDVQSDPRFFRIADEMSGFITRNMVCVPVRTREKTIGALQAINKKNGSFDDEDKDALMAFANQVAISIENANLYQELKGAFYGTAKALAEIIEMRDPYTGGHTHRVMDYSLAIGRLMTLPREELENLKLAAILHDIGKIGVRDNILLKKGSLDSEETKKLNQHSEYGAEILSHVKQLRDVIPGVRNHHEKYDGTGYPDRLKGEEIPLIARIIAVADTFDAMTTDRPYRNAIGVPQAIEELERNAGTCFDSKIVECFVSYINRTGGPAGKADHEA